jgi:hypothetical protein
MSFPRKLQELANQILNESLTTDYFIEKTTDEEVKDLLLKGHYLGAWPFAGSQYKDFIYGIYRRPVKTALDLGEMPTKNILVGCVVYGYAEHHAARYVQDWIRSLISPDESSETFTKIVRAIAKRDEDEQAKAQQRGYEYRPKLQQTIQTFLKTINVQQKEIIELKRLFILPEHDTKNIESYAIQKANDEILKTRQEINVIVSFSDSRVGHYGGIYQATNAAFAGFTKHGLLRYVYFRPSMAETLKRYQTSFEKVAFNYPKPSDIKKKPKMNWDFNKNPEKAAKVVTFLEKELETTQDDNLRNSIKTVLDHIKLSKQMGFKFNT